MQPSYNSQEMQVISLARLRAEAYYSQILSEQWFNTYSHTQWLYGQVISKIYKNAQKKHIDVSLPETFADLLQTFPLSSVFYDFKQYISQIANHVKLSLHDQELIALFGWVEALLKFSVSVNALPDDIDITQRKPRITKDDISTGDTEFNPSDSFVGFLGRTDISTLGNRITSFIHNYSMDGTNIAYTIDDFFHKYTQANKNIADELIAIIDNLTSISGYYRFQSNGNSPMFYDDNIMQFLTSMQNLVYGNLWKILLISFDLDRYPMNIGDTFDENTMIRKGWTATDIQSQNKLTSGVVKWGYRKHSTGDIYRKASVLVFEYNDTH